MANKDEAAPPEPANIAIPSEKTLRDAIEALKPIAERSALFDTRRMATIMILVLQSMLGVDEKDRMQIPSTHHK